MSCGQSVAHLLTRQKVRKSVSPKAGKKYKSFTYGLLSFRLAVFFIVQQQVFTRFMDGFCELAHICGNSCSH